MNRSRTILPARDQRRHTLARHALVAAVLFSLGAGCSSKGPPGPEKQCLDTCASLGRECGEVCGQACGACGVDASSHATTCVAGLCRCVPACSPDACNTPDGCGGTCLCAADTSCLTCALRLVRASQAGDARAVERVGVAVEWNGSTAGPFARVADLRILPDPGLEVERVQLHEPVIDAKKLIHRFTETNLPWRRLEDGSIQLLLLPGPHNDEIRPGRWLTVYFTNPTNKAGPLHFRLVTDQSSLAPVEAHTLASDGSAAQPLVVRPEG